MLINLLRRLNLASRAATLNQRAKSFNVPGMLTAMMLMEVALKSGGVCAWCGKPITEETDAQFDHVFPFRLQGENTPENLTFSCAECNRRKSDKHPVRFAQEQAANGILTPLIQRLLTDNEQDAMQQLTLL
ncbi:MAG: HNH endonuclease [Chloroflexi bacterium]|nr:MAG: HNH endonuclease [Chloroflexota bacterium]